MFRIKQKLKENEHRATMEREMERLRRKSEEWIIQKIIKYLFIFQSFFATIYLADLILETFWAGDSKSWISDFLPSLTKALETAPTLFRKIAISIDPVSIPIIKPPSRNTN